MPDIFDSIWVFIKFAAVSRPNLRCPKSDDYLRPRVKGESSGSLRSVHGSTMYSIFPETMVFVTPTQSRTFSDRWCAA